MALSIVNDKLKQLASNEEFSDEYRKWCAQVLESTVGTKCRFCRPAGVIGDDFKCKQCDVMDLSRYDYNFKEGRALTLEAEPTLTYDEHQAWHARMRKQCKCCVCGQNCGHQDGYCCGYDNTCGYSSTYAAGRYNFEVNKPHNTNEKTVWWNWGDRVKFYDQKGKLLAVDPSYPNHDIL